MLPSPNPKRNKTESNSAIHHSDRNSDKRKSARETQSLGAGIPDPNASESGCPKQNAYPTATLIVQAFTAAFAFLAFCAAAYYASIASKQLDETRNNAATELRAYVSVQAEHGDAVTLVTDPKANETRVSISFFNAGQTPAHNFHTDFATGGVSKSTGSFNGDHIQRYQTVGNGPFSGLTAGGGGSDIPAKSVHIEYLPTEQMPTKNEWDEIIGAKRNFWIYGNYEYCDEFGGYHCQMLSFEYQTSPRSGFVPSMFMDQGCFSQPVVPPDEPAPIKVLKRCPQPEEQKQAQSYADSNAGKVFPAHTGKSESGLVQFNGAGRSDKPTATPTK